MRRHHYSRKEINNAVSNENKITDEKIFPYLAFVSTEKGKRNKNCRKAITFYVAQIL